MSPKVLFVAAEAIPLAKTGGLGDVVSALAAALQSSGVDVTIMLPGYPEALERAVGVRQIDTLDGLPGGRGHLMSGRMPDTDVPVLLLRMDALYDRAGGPYMDEGGTEYPDNALRFGALCHAATRVALGRTRVEAPHLVHVHDWHAGLVPLLMKTQDGKTPPTIATIHNLAFQGNFPMRVAGELMLPADALGSDGVEFWGQVSFLKAAVRYAERVTTVSHTYAQEILTPQFGCGFEGLLQKRRDRLSAVPNGIDTDVWDPTQDHLIAAPYGVEDMKGKVQCKKVLQQTFGLTIDPFAQLMALGSRLTSQKMGDVALVALERLLLEYPRLQVAVLGTGEAQLEEGFRALAGRFPQRAAAIIGYDEDTAHALHAGADMLLHGSRFEPFGLTPVYAMRYGTVPIASRVGGLIDTIVDRGSGAEPDPAANGILFEGESQHDMAAAIVRALTAFDNPREWRAMQRNGMRGEYGWNVSAQRYLELYKSTVSGPPGAGFQLPGHEPPGLRDVVLQTAKKRA